MNTDIELNLTVDEINVIMSSLAKQPYEVVFGLVEKIRNQAQLQLSKSKEVTETVSV